MTEFIEQQFVLIDENGKEVDWVDPIRSFSESENYWVISNGLYEYTIKKLPGYTHKIVTVSSIEFF